LYLVTLLRRTGRAGFGKFGHYPKLLTLRKAEERGQESGELALSGAGSLAQAVTTCAS
jgi:hypothetical protein